MKKTFAWLLAFALLLGCFPAVALQASAATEGAYEYAVTNGEATITDVEESIEGDITVPATLGGYPVTAISAGAFSFCGDLTSVTIPAGVLSIGEAVFADCYYLEAVWVDAANPNYCSDSKGVLYNKAKTELMNVPDMIEGSYTIPNSVKTIASYAFGDCEMLESVTIPNGVQTICEYAFGWCPGLNTISIPASVTSIEECAFVYCSNVDGLWVDSANPNYCSDSKGVLYNKTKTEIVAVPNGMTGSYTVASTVKTIGASAFDGCEFLETVNLPNGLQIIGENAFAWCSELKSINIPSSVTTIEPWAFNYCTSLTSVNIPASVTDIGECVFADCYCLEAIWVDAANPNYCSDSKGVLYNKAKTELLNVPDTIEGSYTIPDSVKTIAGYAFSDCEMLESVTIPNGVQTIGECAFAWCYSLTSICIPGSVRNLESDAFYGCYSLTMVIIGSSVQTISSWAFASCTNLTTVYLPKSVTVIDYAAFESCESLTDVYYAGTESQWNTVDIGDRNEYLTGANIHFNADIPGAPEQPDQPDVPEIPDNPAEPGAPGNLDGDAYINENDAIYLLQHVLMPDLFQVTQDADFDKDGEVNEDDAIYLLQHILMPDLFPL